MSKPADKIKLATAQEIFKNAQKSPSDRALKDSGEYNTGYMLSHDQIQAAALLKISEAQGISPEEAAAKYYINGTSVRNVTINHENMREVFGPMMINQAIEVAKSGKPAFFSIDDHSHFALVALIPGKPPAKASIVYINSIQDQSEALQGVVSALTAQRTEEIQQNNFTIVEDLNTQIGHTQEMIKQNKNHANVGLVFSGYLVKYAQQRGLAVSDKVIDQSQDQQYDNCCGLSVADNIAKTAQHLAGGKPLDTLKESLFRPKSDAEKQEYYKTFGKKVFDTLKQDDILLGTSTGPGAKDPKLDIKIQEPTPSVTSTTTTVTATATASKTPVDTLGAAVVAIADHFDQRERAETIVAQIPGIHTEVPESQRKQMQEGIHQAKKARTFLEALRVFKNYCSGKLALMAEFISSIFSRTRAKSPPPSSKRKPGLSTKNNYRNH